jgi:hypothetical protein
MTCTQDFKPVQGMRQTSYGSLAAVVRALGLKPSRKAATNVRKLVRKGHTGAKLFLYVLAQFVHFEVNDMLEPHGKFLFR